MISLINIQIHAMTPIGHHKKKKKEKKIQIWPFLNGKY